MAPCPFRTMAEVPSATIDGTGETIRRAAALRSDGSKPVEGDIVDKPSVWDRGHVGDDAPPALSGRKPVHWMHQPTRS